MSGEDSTGTEARILSAADALFYEHGVQAVGMDRVRDASGVSLKKIYQCFPSKGALVEAYLRRRDQWARTALEERVARYTDPEARVLAVFDWLYEWVDGPDFHGCAFINAYGELGTTAEGVARATRDHKRALHAYLTDLVRPLNHPSPTVLATQLAFLVDGAITAAAISGDPASADTAAAAARVLVGASAADPS